jgi:pyruvate formate lyase activating enzyme
VRIGGLQKHSLIDFPGRLSAVVFTQGCNFRCPYCHNPELVYPEMYGPLIEEEKVLSLLWKRRRFLDGVVITGGEPLLQPDIESFIERIKEMGYLIKLDTNGSLPERLYQLLRHGLVDYVAMDYKAPSRAYSRVASVEIDTEKIKRSIEYITSSGVDYEIRTTLFRGLRMSSILDMIMELRDMRVEIYYLQMFVPFKECSTELMPESLDIDHIKELLLCNFWKSGIRNLDEKKSVRRPVYD